MAALLHDPTRFLILESSYVACLCCCILFTTFCNLQRCSSFLPPTFLARRFTLVDSFCSQEIETGYRCVLMTLEAQECRYDIPVQHLFSSIRTPVPMWDSASSASRRLCQDSSSARPAVNISLLRFWICSTLGFAAHMFFCHFLPY